MVVALVLVAAACTRDATPAAVAAIQPSAPASAAASDAPVVHGVSAKPATAVADAPDDHAAVNAAIDAALGDHAKYEQLISAFQSAVAGHDPAAVAALVAYPFIAYIDGKAVGIADADAFVAHYDAILTPAVARAITAQKYSELFVNYKGVMFGNGQAWINGVCEDTACGDAQARVVAIQPVQ
jgi:hypothetical protein